MLVIFDCDGVLVDSEILSAQVFAECLAEQYGIDVSADYSLETYRGKSVANCIQMITQELANHLQWQHLSPEQQHINGAAFWRHVQLQTLVACDERLNAVEGVEAVLQALQQQQIRFCVASNGKHEKMAVTLAKTQLMPYVAGNVFSFEDVSQGKPAPDLFLYAAKTMGIAAEKCVVVEDSLTGIVAAQAAGMRVLAYCPASKHGADNAILSAARELGAECFFSMNQLPSLLIHSAH